MPIIGICLGLEVHGHNGVQAQARILSETRQSTVDRNDLSCSIHTPVYCLGKSENAGRKDATFHSLEFGIVN